MANGKLFDCLVTGSVFTRAAWIAIWDQVNSECGTTYPDGIALNPDEGVFVEARIVQCAPPPAAPRSGETAIPTMQHHPKSSQASPERLRALAGVIALKGPVPSTKCLDETEPGPHNAAAPQEET